MNTFMEDYSRGVEHIDFVAPYLAKVVRSLGYPRANEEIPTARVVLDARERTITFEIAPAYIADRTDDAVAAVLTHETMHVVLEHLNEMADEASYPNRRYLVEAQECIINDSLEGMIGVTVDENCMHGLAMFQQDFSIFTTRQAYTFVENFYKDEVPETSDDSSQDGVDDSASGGDRAGASGSKSGEASSKSGDSSDNVSEGSSSSGSSTDDRPGEDTPDVKEKSEEAGSASDSDEGVSSDDAGSAAAEGYPQACDHIEIINGDDLTEDEISKILQSVLSDVFEDINPADLPTQMQKAAEAHSNFAPGSTAPDKSGFAVIDSLSGLSMNWRPLLEKINPKLKTAGARKPKDNWMRQNRRLASIYPTVVLPSSERASKARDKGGELPTVILALDMSPSIPKRLLGDLASIATNIPDEYIRALPITWSSGYRIFDPSNPRQIVPAIGTIIQTVQDYAAVIARETGDDPYVIVITDGGFSTHSLVHQPALERWTWMGITASDTQRLQSMFGPKSPHRTGPVLSLNDYI